MDPKKLALMPAEHRHIFYRIKILQYSPPKTAHDEYMLDFYAGLLDKPEVLSQLSELDNDIEE